MHSDLDDLKNLPILEIAQRLGIEVKRNKALCFCHKEISPSVAFSPNRNLWHCFGCGIGGSNIDLVMQYLRVDFKTAVSWLRDQTVSSWSFKSWPSNKHGKAHASSDAITRAATVPASQQDVSASPDIYRHVLSQCPLTDVGRRYLEARGFSLNTISQFAVGECVNPRALLKSLRNRWSSSELLSSGVVVSAAEPTSVRQQRLIWWVRSLVFPFFTKHQITYLQGRSLEPGAPKYVNLYDIPKPLYNTNILEDVTPGQLVYLCEGVTDVLAAAQLGFPAVGVLGASSFQSRHVQLLRPYSIVVVPDVDAAGQHFANAVRNQFRQSGKTIQVARLAGVKDLAELIAHAK